MPFLYYTGIFVALVFSVLSGLSSAQAAERVTLKLQWLDQFQFAGYYMAKEKGFYKTAGLSVKIIPYENGSQDVVQEISKGKVQYGAGRSSLIVDRVVGKPVVVVAAIFQHSPAVLLTRDDTGIERISDLIGRNVMISSEALVSADIMGMLTAENVRPHDIIHQRHSFNLDDLILKKTDAMASYVSNEPFVLRERAIGFRMFHPKDYGQDYYGDLLFTSVREAKFHPERVKAFRTASLKGWAYAFAHIEETVKLIKRSYNKQNKTFESLIFEGQELKKLAYEKGLALGDVSMEKMQDIAALYHSKGMLPDNYDLSGLVFGK